MTTGEAVVIGWFQIPSESMPSGWSEHKVSCQLSGEGVRLLSALFQVSPLRPTPSMNSAFLEMVHGFLKKKSVSHSVEFLV
jgi:hypothetical protein